MEHQPALILWLCLFPGRNDQNIIYGKLVEILLPVVNPVDILSFVHADGSFSDIHKLLQP